MHETVIATNIIRKAKKYGKVKEIYLGIGELASVPAHELIECLRRMIIWDINSKEKPAKVKCKCGFEGRPKILERGHDFFFIECPECKKIPKLIDGTEIEILKVVVE